MIQNYFRGSEKQLHNIEYSQETQIVCNKVQTTGFTEEEQGQIRHSSGKIILSDSCEEKSI